METEFDNDDLDDDSVDLKPEIEYENPFDTFLESYKSSVESLNSLFESLPCEICHAISKGSSERKSNCCSTLAYGEIEFESFGSFILNLYKDLDLDTKNEQMSFVDIGCGSGKAVFSAYMMNIFSKCTGIEIIADLHKTCQQVLRDYNKHFLSSPDDLVYVDFVLGDATYIDWKDYDVAFVYATCFDSPMMHRLTQTAQKMNTGSIIIILSKR